MGEASILLVAYHRSLVACTALAILVFTQVIVVDLLSIRAKHVPGMPVTEGHGSVLFRAVRAHANTNENLGLFVLLLVTAILLGASAPWVNGFAWLFTGARAGHMGFYYAKLSVARSIAFGAGLLAQLGLIVECVAKLL